MEAMRTERIPLFPLNVVLLPGADLPLHIFEPRYRAMVKQCLANSAEFGMLLALPNGVAHVGCTAEIVEVVKRYRDGRMDILTVGRAPFRVVELYPENPLLEGRVDYMEDRESRSDAKMRNNLVELYEVCYTLLYNDYPRNTDGELPDNFSYVVASTLPLDLLWKQHILELRTEGARVEQLLAYLRQWAPHLQKTGALRRSAGGDGHGLN
jgi:Lon protease-like protein